ncbi:MAG: hypothetical protein JW791_02875 [Nanoarchaeota archaeon]|nr:hypothetical protein [Nanoarchaeota archaeon]
MDLEEITTQYYKDIQKVLNLIGEKTNDPSILEYSEKIHSVGISKAYEYIKNYLKSNELPEFKNLNDLLIKGIKFKPVIPEAYAAVIPILSRMSIFTESGKGVFNDSRDQLFTDSDIKEIPRIIIDTLKYFFEKGKNLEDGKEVFNLAKWLLQHNGFAEEYFYEQGSSEPVFNSGEFQRLIEWTNDNKAGMVLVPKITIHSLRNGISYNNLIDFAKDAFQIGLSTVEDNDAMCVLMSLGNNMAFELATLAANYLKETQYDDIISLAENGNGYAFEFLEKNLSHLTDEQKSKLPNVAVHEMGREKYSSLKLANTIINDVNKPDRDLIIDSAIENLSLQLYLQFFKTTVENDLLKPNQVKELREKIFNLTTSFNNLYHAVAEQQNEKLISKMGSPTPPKLPSDNDLPPAKDNDDKKELPESRKSSFGGFLSKK